VTLDEIVAKFDPRRKPIANGWTVHCPSHQDDTGSLAIVTGTDGRTLLKCHANCATESILFAVGLKMADLFATSNGRGQPGQTYDYHALDGTLVYQVCRFPNGADGSKTFRQRRPDGAGGWIWKMVGVERVLYHWPKLKGREASFVVEGEKDADRLWALGLPATTNAGGAGKWSEALTQQLAAAGVKRVVVLADNDPPGEAHARTVGRSCDDAGLFTKVILLPSLPPKGDVSDWLDAGHTKAELLEVVRAAPVFQPRIHPVSAPLKLELTSLSDLLAEPDEAVEWLVEGRIPAGGVILFAGKPKAGKSVICRGLAFAVATGQPWLAHQVTAGPVWYLALEDKRSEVRKHFRQMGATGKEPLWLVVGDVPGDVLALLHARAAQERPALIIVDTLQRLIRVKDMSDYAEVTNAFSPLLSLCRQTGAALMVVHHARKSGEGMDAILGSTALAGSVDNMFILVRGEDFRALSSVQRIGKDMEPLVVDLDDATGQMKLIGSKREVEEQQVAGQIDEALTEEGSAQTEGWIKAQVDCSQPKLVSKALRRLHRQGRVERSGEGKRGNPYLYRVSTGAKPNTLEYPIESQGLTAGNDAILWKKGCLVYP
jgi:hypothetical protein